MWIAEEMATSDDHRSPLGWADSKLGQKLPPTLMRFPICSEEWLILGLYDVLQIQTWLTPWPWSSHWANCWLRQFSQLGLETITVPLQPRNSCLHGCSRKVNSSRQQGANLTVNTCFSPECIHWEHTNILHTHVLKGNWTSTTGNKTVPFLLEKTVHCLSRRGLLFSHVLFSFVFAVREVKVLMGSTLETDKGLNCCHTNVLLYLRFSLIHKENEVWEKTESWYRNSS